jgi:hypothetical protein
MLGNLVPHAVQQVRVLAEQGGQLRPRSDGGATVVQPRPYRDRGQGGDVDPTLEQLAGTPQPAVPRRTIVGTEPGPERQLVRAGEHLHAVELDHLDAVDDRPQVAHVATDLRRRAASSQPERGEHESAGACERQGRHRRDASGRAGAAGRDRSSRSGVTGRR